MTNRAFTIALVAAMIITTVPFATMAEEPPPARGKVSIDFHEAPLTEVVKFYANLMKVNFIVSRELEGKRITVLAPNPVTRDEAWQALSAALSMNGMTAVRRDGFVRVLPASDGPATAPIDGPKSRTERRARPDLGNMRVPPGMRLSLVELSWAYADDLQPVIAKLASKDARVIADARTNTLIVIEHPRQIRRLIAVAEALDSQQGQERVYVVPIENRDATELGKTLEQLRVE